MARPFTLPDLGEGLTEAEIVKVLVREGDVIAEDTPLLEVETDKATVEIPSPMSGRVEKIHVEPNQTVKVGQVLVTFADAGATTAKPTGKQAADTMDPTRKLAPEPRTTVQDGRARQSGATAPAGADRAEARALPNVDAPVRTGPVPATPATRRLARELGVDLHTVRATGPGGRVTDEDVRAAAAGGGAPATTTAPAQPARAEPAAAPAPAKPLATHVTEPPLPNFEQWGAVERQPLSHLRRTIAERMTLSATVIPHVTHFDRADITDLDAVITRNLEAAKARGVTLTLTSFILKAAALALAEHPTFNASLDPSAGQLVVKRYVNLGVAVATERGLIVPVLRDVDRKPVLDVARELGALAQRVREGKATLDDLRGGTFTVTNIGALGGTGAIPIINYPEVAILGVARGRQEAVVRDGAVVPRLLLPLSLTFDHRVADGADGARFASAIVRRLERPDELLLGL
ncbi:MAG TPA: dihydrolipoamide acetyltransferase family protein [Methylomirabilota bacterium]|jgi:pyruvate dehydrogenase E2 component (dihydrolipoamide acetyltransferase)|nr:dihydrolipoamide acetyltransferase family protein [Methylomirabilota bacterium]